MSKTPDRRRQRTRPQETDRANAAVTDAVRIGHQHLLALARLFGRQAAQEAVVQHPLGTNRLAATSSTEDLEQ